MPASTIDSPVASISAGATMPTMNRCDPDHRDRSKAPATTRRQHQRRRHIDPTTCERDYSDREVEFMKAMDEYKQSSGRMFPTCSEILEVLHGLGYVQLSDEQFAHLGLNDEDAIPPHLSRLKELS